MSETRTRKWHVATRVLSERGIRGLWDSVKEKIFSAEYQQRISHVFRLRQDIIEAAIPENALSILDIGSNLGDVAALLAQSTRRHVVAWEPDEPVHLRSVRRHRTDGQLILCTGSFGPSVLAKLPEFDAILLLNVLHNWAKQFGAPIAEEMFAGLGLRTKTIIFQGSTLRSFGQSPLPGFARAESERIFWQDYLARVFPKANIQLSGSVFAGNHMTQPQIDIYRISVDG